MKRSLICAIVLGAALHAQAFEWKDVPLFTAEFAQAAGLRRIPLHVDTGELAYPVGSLVAGGVPLPKGELRDAARACVLGPDKSEIPCQTLPLAWWPDKSVKWLLVEFRTQRPDRSPTYFLEYGAAVRRAAADDPIRIDDSPTRLTIDAGALKAVIDKTTGSILDQVYVDRNRDRAYSDDEQMLAAPAHSYMILRDIEGDRSGPYTTLLDRQPEYVIEKRGSEEVTVLERSWHYDARGYKTTPVDIRLTFFRNLPIVRLYHTFMVSENPSVILYPSFGIELPFGPADEIVTSIDGKRATARGDVTLYQDSAASYWYPKCNQFAPFCRLLGSTPAAGKRADGWMQLRRPGRSLTVFMNELWQNFPKALTYRGRALRVELWPEAKHEAMNMRRVDQGLAPDYTIFMETESPTLRGYEYTMNVYHSAKMTFEDEVATSAWGAGKSHDIWLRFDDGDPAAFARRAARPLLPFVSGAWNSFTEVAGRFHPEDVANFPKLERSIQRCVETVERHQREWFNWYGMWRWGNFQTDYFPADYRFGGRRWNNFNTKYGWRNGGMGIPFGYWMQYLRSGRRGRFDAARQVTQCHMDVPSRHPRAWTEGRLMPVDPNRVGGGVRYDVHPWGPGGGNYDSQHTWVIGIAMHFYITGNFRARDVVEEYIDSAIKGSKIYRRGLKCPFHARTEDMTTAVAAVAREIDPDSERCRKFFDAMTLHEAAGMSAIANKDGRLMFSDSGAQLDWMYRLYKGTNVMYALAVQPVPKLIAAVLKGHPVTAPNGLYNSGLLYDLCWRYSGNPNFARMAARFLTVNFAEYANTDQIERDKVRSPYMLGYDLIEEFFMMRAAYEAKVQPHPLLMAQLPQVVNHPLGDEVRYRPVDLRASCNFAPFDPPAPAANEDFAKGPVRFDFGPRGRVEPGWLPCGRDDYFPSCASRPTGPFADLPFGAIARVKDVDFALVNPRTNNGRGCIVLRAGDKPVVLPIGLEARRIHLLTGVSLAADAFHNKPGARYTVTFADRATASGTLDNMVHYQALALAPMLFDRAYYAGTPSTYHLSVVPIDVGDKVVQSITLAAGDVDAQVVIFAVSVELAQPEPRRWILRDRIGKSSKEPIDYSAPAANRDYMLSMRLSQDFAGCPVRVLLDGSPILDGARPVGVTTYQVPIRISDGQLRLRFVPGEKHRKHLDAVGTLCVHEVGLSNIPDGNVLAVAEPRASKAKRLAYGWRLRGPRAAFRAKQVRSIQRSYDKYIPADNMMEDDDLVMDKWKTVRGEFIVDDVPPGTYKVTLYIRDYIGAGLVDIRVEDQLHEDVVLLPAHGRPKPYHVTAKIDNPFVYTVPVTDGQFNLVVDMKKANQHSGRGWSITGLVLEKAE